MQNLLFLEKSGWERERIAEFLNVYEPNFGGWLGIKRGIRA
jgi:hypothetical protein